MKYILFGIVVNFMLFMAITIFINIVCDTFTLKFSWWMPIVTLLVIDWILCTM